MRTVDKLMVVQVWRASEFGGLTDEFDGDVLALRGEPLKGTEASSLGDDCPERCTELMAG